MGASMSLLGKGKPLCHWCSVPHNVDRKAAMANEWVHTVKASGVLLNNAKALSCARVGIM